MAEQATSPPPESRMATLSREDQNPSSTSPPSASPMEKDPITCSVESGKLDPSASTKSPSDPGNLLSTSSTDHQQQASAGSNASSLSDTNFSPPSDDVLDSVKALHPYAQILGLADIESCVALENACFPPHQACSREKFVYRLSACSELCLGLFSSATPETKSGEMGKVKEAATMPTANAPDSAEPRRKGVLLGHLVATKCEGHTITDEDMGIPSSGAGTASVNGSKQAVGHQEAGRTIAIHSLCVLPEFQGRGLGNTLMKAYVQRMVESDNADRISLLTFERLKGYYEKLGFEDRGRSNVTYGGGGWWDMVLDFQRVRASMDDD